MRDYVGTSIKMKIENSGKLSQEECDKQNEYHKRLGFNFIIKPVNTVENLGLRQVAKICLNSLWGKFGQKSNLDSYEFVKDYNKLIRRVSDSKIKCKTIDIISESCVEFRYFEDIDKMIEPEYISEIVAVMTTANARMRLYDLLDWLDPSQIIYCDTDSCIFMYDDTTETNKKPDNDLLRPKSVMFGSGLGQWSNEFKPEFYQ